MRVSVAVALVVLAIVALSNADKKVRQEFEVANPSSWDSHAHLFEPSTESSKRDVKVDSTFKFSLWYSDDDEDDITEIDQQVILFNGKKQRAGYVSFVNSYCDITATRRNFNGETQLTFDIDGNGKDILPKSDDYDNIHIDIEDIQSYTPATSVSTFVYIWTHSNTGRPTFAFTYTIPALNSAQNFYETFPKINAQAIVRTAFVKVLADMESECAEAIDDYSLLEAACIPPRADGKIHTTSLQVGQLFQNAPKNLKSSDFEYHVRNCYGYDQKICQVASKRFVDFDQGTQAFYFEKPCAGVPNEQGCATTVDVVLKERMVGEGRQCKDIHSKVIIPQSWRSIKNKWGQAECRVTPSYDVKLTAGNLMNDFIDGKFATIEKKCARLQGCYSKPSISQPNVVDMSSKTFLPPITTGAPFTIEQCNYLCLFASPDFKFSAIGDSGEYCSCILDVNPTNPLSPAPYGAPYVGQAQSLSSCDSTCANTDAAESDNCGTSNYVLVHSLEQCKRLQTAMDTFIP